MEKIDILNNQLAMLSFVTWLLFCLLNDMLVIFTFLECSTILGSMSPKKILYVIYYIFLINKSV